MKSPEYISGLEELNSVLQHNINKTIMLMFTASWCGPCKRLKEHLYTTQKLNWPDDNESSEIKESGICVDYQNDLLVVYIDVDDENNEELSSMYDVSSMPTQILIQMEHDKENNKLNIIKKDEIIGCDIISLKMKLEKLIKKS